MKTNIKITRVVMAIVAATLSTGVYAKGGSPASGTGLYTVPTLTTPSYTIAQAAAVHGFDHVGILQSATAPSCGGTATINSIKITVPCNTIIQMPANTFRWEDMVNYSATTGKVSLIGTELHVVGNIVNGEYIAALMYISQQSLNSGSGVITSIDKAAGRLTLDTGAIIEINDPNGRFSKGQSPDPRFSVDDENPTIHASTGYPMCIPRPPIAPATDDPLCPQNNRPMSTATTACRLFGAAGVSPLPTSGELTQTPAGQFCRQFVMNSVAARSATDPDPRQQAPFEVGDYINYSGTLIDDLGIIPYISAHTIEANVGIYTQPHTRPSYIAMGDFGIGTADPTALTSVAGVAQETQTKIFLEAETTDVQTPVDIYIVDVNSSTGAKSYRWISPYDMTGECNPAAALPISCMGTQGGITTQFTEAQPQRARIRARDNKSTAVANMTSAPGRNFAVMARSFCNPKTIDTLGHVTDTTCLNNINGSKVANGLAAGMYSAPVFEYIFPENTKPGDIIVPNDFWHLPFLVNGEGNGVGALSPKPW